MKAIVSLLFLPLLVFFACSDKNTTVVPPPEDKIFTFVNNQTEIFAPIVQQLPFSKLEATITYKSSPDSIKSTYTLLYSYYPDGKIKTVISPKGDIVANNIYEANTLKSTYPYPQKISIFYLDSEGLVLNKQGENSKDSYYFKNGFLLQSVGAFATKRVYSQRGNLLSCEQEEQNITYEYTDYINNIRQEVLRTSTFHWSFRDLYLGKFSTNLLKSASFDGVKILDFAYQFDSQNRVSKVIVTRNNIPVPAMIEYKITY